MIAHSLRPWKIYLSLSNMPQQQVRFLTTNLWKKYEGFIFNAFFDYLEENELLFKHQPSFYIYDSLKVNYCQMCMKCVNCLVIMQYLEQIDYS